jgi:hypothetical protein
VRDQAMQFARLSVGWNLLQAIRAWRQSLRVNVTFRIIE